MNAVLLLTFLASASGAAEMAPADVDAAVSVEGEVVEVDIFAPAVVTGAFASQAFLVGQGAILFTVFVLMGVFGAGAAIAILPLGVLFAPIVAVAVAGTAFAFGFDSDASWWGAIVPAVVAGLVALALSIAAAPVAAGVLASLYTPETTGMLATAGILVGCAAVPAAIVGGVAGGTHAATRLVLE